MVWWSDLDEEVQGIWKLLKKAMLSQYGSIFCGGSGEEAEKFIRAVRDKALERGRTRTTSASSRMLCCAWLEMRYEHFDAASF